MLTCDPRCTHKQVEHAFCSWRSKDRRCEVGCIASGLHDDCIQKATGRRRGQAPPETAQPPPPPPPQAAMAVDELPSAHSEDEPMEDADATRAIVASTSLLPGDPITVWFSDEERRRVDRYNGSVLKSDEADITVAWRGGVDDGRIYRVARHDDDWMPGWYDEGLGYEAAMEATPLTNSMAQLMSGPANSAVSHDRLASTPLLSAGLG